MSCPTLGLQNTHKFSAGYFCQTVYLVLCARMKLYISMLKMSVFVVFWPAEDVDTWNFVSTLRCLDLNCADLVFDLAVNAMYVISGRCL